MWNRELAGCLNGERRELGRRKSNTRADPPVGPGPPSRDPMVIGWDERRVEYCEQVGDSTNTDPEDDQRRR
ncbi:hypothetical protein Sjap_026282 [Stephania japonica]|uniref:Uncharacterized protein n=1 Tax=Stephania japonica TaxID=461633 RepID=A0AAP0E3A9_9MAGN